MRKYKLVVEAELEVNDWCEADLSLLEIDNKVFTVDNDGMFSEYKLILELFESYSSETTANADIKKVKVEEIND